MNALTSVTMKDEIPLRDQRELCYKARDAFFTCCDKNNIANPMTARDAVQKWCKRDKQKFDRDCMDSWVHGSSASESVTNAPRLIILCENE
jgi:hypothetical protein